MRICADGAMPWNADHDRRALLYRFNPGHAAYTPGVAEFSYPDWVEDMSEEEKVRASTRHAFLFAQSLSGCMAIGGGSPAGLPVVNASGKAARHRQIQAVEEGVNNNEMIDWHTSHLSGCAAGLGAGTDLGERMRTRCRSRRSRITSIGLSPARASCSSLRLCRSFGAAQPSPLSAFSCLERNADLSTLRSDSSSSLASAVAAWELGSGRSVEKVGTTVAAVGDGGEAAR